MATPTRANELDSIASPAYYIVGRADGRYGSIPYGELPGVGDLAGTPYESRAVAEAAEVPVEVMRISLFHAGRLLTYIDDGDGTALETAGGRTWSPGDGLSCPQHWGAFGDGATDDVAAIQAGIDWLNNLGGGTLYFPAGTYIVGQSGSQVGSRDYGLLIKDGVILEGESMWAVILKAEDGSDIDLINTDRAASQSLIGVRNMTLDGNEAEMSGAVEGFNIWAWDIDDLIIENVRSLNPATWGIRIERCSRVFLSNIQCDHSAESNSDGIHFVDTSDVVASNMWIKSQGDDAFIIEAKDADVDSYSISGLFVQSQSGLAAGMRGLLLLGDASVMSGARVIRNIDVTGLVVKDTTNIGISMAGASYEGIRISGTIDGGCAQYGVMLSPGVGAYPGELTECVLDLVIRDITGNFVACSVANGTIDDNTIRLRAANPGDGDTGVALYGDRWNGEIAIDYNEDGAKTTFGYGLALYGDENDLGYACRGAGTALLLQGSAQNNTIRLGTISGSATRDIEILSGATGHRFVGGRLSGGVLNSGGVTNKWFGVAGATTYALTTINMATAGDGTVTIAHGLNGTPQVVFVQVRHPGVTFHVNVTAHDATNITLQVYNTSGSLITTGTYNIFYEASL